MIMKTSLAAIIILMMILTGVKGQTSDTIKKARYGLEISQFITGSGFASGTELIVTVVPDKIKNLSFGLYFCPERKKITGVTIHQEMTLKKFTSYKKITPYAFFNLIYRRSKVREVLADKNAVGEYGMYKSIEHHLGIGLRIRILDDLYFKGSLGYGLYLGSIKKPSEPDALTGEVRGTNGFGGIAKIGIAYTF
jgi:hypothetical protein